MSRTAMHQLAFAGQNGRGECLLPRAGDTVATPTLAPLAWLDDERRVLRAAGGNRFTLLLDDHGCVYAAGANMNGQLGPGH